MDLKEFCSHYRLSSDQYQLLTNHLEWVIDENSRVRLTAIEDKEQGLRLHVGDSLEALPEVAEAPLGKILDMGSGGGFPGVPLAIVTGREVVCLDSVQKKMRALQQFITNSPTLAPLMSVEAVRAEELAVMHPNCYSAVIARALSSLPALIELSSPLLEEEGHLIAMKGNIEDVELERGNEAGAVCGMVLDHVRKYRLFGGDEQRAIVVYKKVRPSKISLPRRAGLAQRRPLA